MVIPLFAEYSCEKQTLIAPVGFETEIEADSIVFAEIGDFGFSGPAEKSVADMVKSWNPDFIISAGDNNYYEGKLSTIKSNITNYYGDYIYNFDAPSAYRCNGKAFDEQINRFFPTAGNHDVNNKDGLVPYYNYFTLPEIEKYYKFRWGPVTFFSINSAEGNLPEQEIWLQDQLDVTTSPFKIVFLHHPPYSSGAHGNNTATQWDYYNMGIDIVFAGHDHDYERIEKNGEESTYFLVNGLGGKATSDGEVHPLSAASFHSFYFGNNYGAIKITGTYQKLIVEFYSIGSPDIPIDKFEITH
jgi:predicted phosphodiesterase